MAGDWIKMRLSLQTHPKIVRILSATKSDKFRAIGGLHAVWSVFDTHSVDGRLDGYTPETLDHIIGWNGFSEALISVGWLALDGDDALVLPDFDEHNGASGKRRAEDQKRKRNSRKSPHSVRNLSDEDADSDWTREEKRREEKHSMSAAEAADDHGDSPSGQFGNPDDDPDLVERRKKPRPADDDFRVARWLFDCAKEFNPTAKQPNFQTWADDVRLLRERDGRSHKEICALFRWAKGNSFWGPNIQSPSKLREKWDQLAERRARDEPPAPPVKKDWI